MKDDDKRMHSVQFDSVECTDHVTNTGTNRLHLTCRRAAASGSCRGRRGRYVRESWLLFSPPDVAWCTLSAVEAVRYHSRPHSGMLCTTDHRPTVMMWLHVKYNYFEIILKNFSALFHK